MKLSELMLEDKIVLDFKARNKKEVIDALVETVVNGFDREKVLSALLEREELGSTGVGNGVALPHVRMESVHTPVVVFARSHKPVDFGAIDGVPCSLFFLVLGPTGQVPQEEYLQAMAKISRLMRDPIAREKLNKVSTAGEAVDAIREYEA